MADNAPYITIIEPKSNPLGLRQVGEYWRYRDLLYFLARRDVLVRYKQTILGASWTVVNPLITMSIFTLVFGRFGGLPSDGVPYSVFVFSGLLPWMLFAAVLNQVSSSLLSNAHLISKIYFPRLILPLASIATPLLDFLVALPILLGLMLYNGLLPDARILALPFYLMLGLVLTLGLGLILSALVVAYRDLRFLTGFLIQAFMFLSPVTYTASIVPERWRGYYELNPMVPVLEGIRWSLLGTPPASWHATLLCIGIAALLLGAGATFFHRLSDTFADVI